MSEASVLMTAGGIPLVLASGSRFRRQMLQSAGLRFSVVTATVDEPAERAAMARDTQPMTPSDVARRLAVLKALEVSRRQRDALVIGADQVLDFHGEIFGKPDDAAQARAQLLRLCGRTHTLPTAVVLAQNGTVVWSHLEIAKLTMRAFSATFLDSYVAAAGGAVTETVGGYAVEGLGAQLFERIEGDTFTIIGLPLVALLAELRRRGVLVD